MKRELWELISELVEALAAPQAEKWGLTVTGMQLELPIELVVAQTEVGFRLLIDAPHYRWDAGLRPEAGRMALQLRKTGAQEAAWFAQFGS